MKIGIKWMLLIGIILLAQIDVIAQESCTLKKDSDGIKVYLCETETSPFKQIKVYFETEGSLAEYASGVMNIKKYQTWQSSIIQINILKKITERELIYYSEVDAPWPITNRDLIFHINLNQNLITKVLTVTLEQLPTYIPQKEGLIRIPSAQSTLTVTPIGHNRLSVSYILQVDPGGDIPPALANMFAANTPWNTFNNFRKMLEGHEIKVNKKLQIIN